MDNELYRIGVEKITEAIEMNTKAIAHLNQNLMAIKNELKDMNNEMNAIRRNTIYLRDIKK